MTRSLLPLAAGLLFACAAPAGPVAEYHRLLTAAEKETAQGHYEKADAGLAKAVKVAEAAKDVEAQTEATFERALNLRAWLERDPNPEKQAQLLDLYKAVRVLQPKGAYHDQASNNLGVLYLRAGKANQAVSAFQEVGNLGDDAYVFHYNYGRALEADRRPTDALKQYRLSTDQQATFAPAARAAARLLIDNRDLPGRLDAALDLLRFYDSDDPDGRASLLGALVYDLLARWDDAAGARRFLPFLASDLARGRVDAVRFRNLYEPESRNRRGGSLHRLKETPAAGKPLEELAAIYLSDDFADKQPSFPLLTEEDVFRALPAWKEIGDLDEKRTDKALAAVLELAGESFAEAATSAKGDSTGPSRQALKRFAASFSLDPTRVGPALRVVRTLAANPKLDPNGKLIDKYARRLYQQKGGLLLMAKTREDHAQLQSLHVVLATIFEGQGHWTGDSYSAAFQWREAIRDEATLRRMDPTYPIAPDLRYRLANAYRMGASKGPDAADAFLSAADLYLTVGSAKQADDLLKEFASLREKKTITVDDKQAGLADTLQRVTAGSRRADLRWDLPQPGAVSALALVPLSKAPRLVLGVKDRLLALDLTGEGADLLKPVESRPWKEGPLERLPGAEEKLVSGAGREIWLWDAKTLSRGAKPLGQHADPVRALAVPGSGRWLASVGQNGETKVWSVKEGKEVRTFPPSSPAPRQAACSPDGKQLALGGGKVVTVWTVDGLKVHRQETPDEVTCMGVSADQSLLAAGTSGGEVRLWDFRTGKLLRILKQEQGPVWDLAFAPRGSVLAAAGAGGVRLWDAREGVEVARFGSQLPPKALTFSEDGRLLAVGFGGPSGPGLVRVWDVARLVPR